MADKTQNKGIFYEYFFYQDKYSKLYDFNAVVMMRVGDFYEFYQSDTKGFDLTRISEITNLTKTKRDKRKEKVDENNPYMAGFHYTSLHKFLKMIVDGGITVVVVDQITPAPNPKRAVTGIYSAGTYISENDSNDSNNIVSVYMEDEKQIGGGYLTCIGLSCIDLTTGECCVLETYSIVDDEKYALDETYRFILSCNPKEVIITRKMIDNVSMKKEQLISYFELDNKNVHYNTIINKNFIKQSYQNEFLGKIYKNTGMMSPIEYIDMEKMQYSRMSLIILFDFAYKHNEAFINYLDKPKIFENSKHLILGNNAIHQLNILENNSVDASSAKFKCLFDVVNHTSTGMGRRFLKNAICNPLNDIKEIQLRYDCIDEFLNEKENKGLQLNIDAHLDCISDIERLGRKIFLGLMHPYELANFITSLCEINNIYKLICKTKYNSQYIPEKNVIDQVTHFLDHCNTTYDIVELKKQNLNEINDTFFKKGIYPQIDEINEKMNDNIQIMYEICDTLSKYISDETKETKIITIKMLKTNSYLLISKTNADILKENIGGLDTIQINNDLEIETDKLLFEDTVTKNGKSGKTKIFLPNNIKNGNIEQVCDKLCEITNVQPKKPIILQKTERDGYFLELTKKKSDLLRSSIKNVKTIKINDNLTIAPDKIIFKEGLVGKSGKNGNTKLFFADLNNKSDNVVCLREKMIAMIRKKYSELLTKYANDYKNMFRYIPQFIAKLDFIKSNAKTAKMYNYTKPEIVVNKDNGYMNISKLRHPIVERIRTDVEYIPHDIKLGNSNINSEDEKHMDGMLLYGLNAGGKSTLQKAIGTNLIMAQSGMYVAAKKYIYSPYESLFARITGNDNIFKGLSQFGLEMTELRAILKRNGPKTLVIGDEVCRGTEHISGNCIVAATIVKLALSKCSFIFATHLHEIAKMKRITDLENVQIKHLSVEYDQKSDSLVFDRILKDGPGSSVYGLTVAKYIIKDDGFMKLSQDIMSELMDHTNELLSTKQSHFNKDVFVHSCQVCGNLNTIKEHTGCLDVHHINFQSNCCENGFVIGKSHLQMNSKCNLSVLCKTCHYDVHHNKLVINGFKDTSNGRILDWNRPIIKSIKTVKK